MELNYLAQKIFNKNSFSEINAVQLDQLVVEFPYSSLLHFFYTRKLKDQNAFGYPEAVAKSALYFTNPHWLNHQLNDRIEYRIHRQNGELKSRIVIPEPAYVESDSDSSYNEPDQKKEEPLIGETPITIEKELIATPPNEEIFVETIETSEKPDAPEVEIIQPQEVEVPAEQEPAVTDIFETKTDDAPVEETLVEELEQIHTVEAIPSESIAIEPVVLPEDEFKSAEESVESTDDENKIIHVENEFPETGNSFPVQTEETMQSLENENQPAAPEPSHQAESAASPTAEQNADDLGIIPIEPLYSVDYFAAQGIKLTPEEETKDVLGKRLKSFTDWLKSMKKLHPEKLNTRLDAAVEKTIQNEAEHSNDEANINTEAMAEVLLKQGRLDKALEVYEKLSLLNPAKSAYFAAKIQEIKAY